MEENEEKKEGEEKEISLGKVATGCILLAAIVVIVIVILTIRGCSIQKASTNDGSSTQTVKPVNLVDPNTTETPSNTLETTSKIEENVPSTEEPTPVGKEEVTSEIIPETTKEVVTVDNKPSKEEGISSSEGLVQVAEPSLSKEEEANAMVVSKGIYLLKDKYYAYSVSLAILISSDNMETVEYFCPKKTYDALSSGDTVNVTYQWDNKGAISISTVSK